MAQGRGEICPGLHRGPRGAGTWTSFPTFLLWFSKRPRWFQSLNITGFFVWPWSHISQRSSQVQYFLQVCLTLLVLLFTCFPRSVLSISLRKFWLSIKKKKRRGCHLSKISRFWSGMVRLALVMVVQVSCKSQAKGRSANLLCFFFTKQVAGTYRISFLLLGFPI